LTTNFPLRRPSRPKFSKPKTPTSLTSERFTFFFLC
jgi:hypothetical protein